jgi:hypothetical protein
MIIWIDGRPYDPIWDMWLDEFEDYEEAALLN